MKHIVLISALLLVSSPAPAEVREAPEKLVLAKTSSGQRALTETLAARIKAALLGERYTPVSGCAGATCAIPRQ